jgi:polyhydroxybutyrate depolymerase
MVFSFYRRTLLKCLGEQPRFKGESIMNRSLATLTILLAASFAYGQGQTLNKSLMHNGIRRNYTIYVPSSYAPDTETPLVVNMHGLTLNRNFQMTYSGMNAVAEREDFLVVYPDAVNADWFGPQDNIGFIDQLLDEVSSQYSVNHARVYATGFSGGGMMSYLLSVERPDKFAAIASVGGTRPFASGEVFYPPSIEALPSRPFPLLHIHGTGDHLLPYNGGYSPVRGRNFPPVEQLVQNYVRNNGGNVTPTIVDLPNTDTTDGSTVQKWSYDGGTYLDSAGNAREADVVLYRIANGGHNWPGDSTGWPGWAGTVNYDISASTEIWNFFSRHEVPLLPTWSVDADGDWSQLANWNGAMPNAPGARAAFADVIAAPRTVTLDVPITVGRIDFDSTNGYTIAGANTLTFDAASRKAEINVARGSHTIAVPLTLARNTSISVSPAESTLAMSRVVNAAGVNVEKSGPGTWSVNRIQAGALSIDAGTVQIKPDPSAPGSGTSVLGALAIAAGTAPTATLDLQNGSAVIDYNGVSPVATIRQQILTGRGGPGLGASWNGRGITSSAAAAANAAEPESRSIGYAENSNLPLGSYASFRGQPVDDTSLLMAFTRTGDANLDGVVNDEDVTIVGATYAPGVSQSDWALGDFDYNGFVDDDDVTLLGVFYDPTAPPIGVAPFVVSGQSAAVPEPSALVLIASALGVLLMAVRQRARWVRDV